MKNLESLFCLTAKSMDDLGIPPDLKGYWVLVNAIMIYASDEMQEPSMQEIYYHLEEDDGICVSTQNYDCQVAIRQGYESRKESVWSGYGFSPYKKPSVKKFCQAIAKKIRPQWEKESRPGAGTSEGGKG